MFRPFLSRIKTADLACVPGIRNLASGANSMDCCYRNGDNLVALSLLVLELHSYFLNRESESSEEKGKIFGHGLATVH